MRFEEKSGMGRSEGFVRTWTSPGSATALVQMERPSWVLVISLVTVHAKMLA